MHGRFYVWGQVLGPIVEAQFDEEHVVPTIDEEADSIEPDSDPLLFGDAMFTTAPQTHTKCIVDGLIEHGLSQCNRSVNTFLYHNCMLSI